MNQERMNIVIVGHVDHGKSTVIGRLLADTDSLPKGKLEQVKRMCADNSRPFEYAFLLDALKDEQAQGITIDSARCFFKTTKRHYIVIDAPGHIEFLKNMVTGAARAEAALLVIDANEGIQENSRRHGYLLSMLGIRQVAILVNKMDLVDYDETVFRNIVSEYTVFLNKLDVHPQAFVPISAREGDNIVSNADSMKWYTGASVLEQLDEFRKEPGKTRLPFRLPLQDVYKFTANSDDRRIFAGTIETGSVSVGDEVLFLPSGKRSRVKTIEEFNTPQRVSASAGEAVGVTLDTQIYVKPGEMMIKSTDESANVGTRFKANIFWMGKSPLVKGKNYKLKLASARRQLSVVDIVHVVDASALEDSARKQQVDRHDVAECIFEVDKPLAFDLISDIEESGRFVIVDDYEIAGGGIVLENASHDGARVGDEWLNAWALGAVSRNEREGRLQQTANFVLMTGPEGTGKRDLARALEKQLFESERLAFYAGMYSLNKNDNDTVDGGSTTGQTRRGDAVQRLGEMARIMTDAGQIFISTAHDLDDYDLDLLQAVAGKERPVIVNVGDKLFNRFEPEVELEANPNTHEAVAQIKRVLEQRRAG